MEQQIAGMWVDIGRMTPEVLCGLRMSVLDRVAALNVDLVLVDEEIGRRDAMFPATEQLELA